MMRLAKNSLLPRICFQASRSLRTLPKVPQHEEYFQPIPSSELQPHRVIPLRGYLYLPGNNHHGMPKHAYGPRDDFPLALRCHNGGDYGLDDWGKIIREVLDENIPKYGAVLIRGAPIKDQNDFSTLMNATNFEMMEYKFGSDQRRTVCQNTFGASEHASPVIIEMHTEGSYRPENIQLFRKVIFYCQRPSPSDFGGETPICRISEVAERLNPVFLQKLKEKKISYHIKMKHPNQDATTNWKTRMNVENEQEAEELMKELGLSWTWSSDGSITYSHTRSAFITHPDTGKEILYNQATTHHKSYCDHVSSYPLSKCWQDYIAGKHATYGDGEEFEGEFLHDYRNAQWSTAACVPLKHGDVLFMDNLEVQHGRLNYHGDRKLYISLTAN